MKEIYLPSWKLEEWAELTEINAHGKRLERIADYCATFAEGEARGEFEDMAGILNKLNCRHECRGHLTPVMYQIRHIIEAEMYNRIEEQFGAEVLAKIRNT